jgi:UDP-glucose 4-epimerase
VISIFTQRAQQGLPISVFGDGEQTRDFFYVADLVELLLQGLLVPEVAGGAVNVGWNQATSLNQLLAEVGDLFGGLPPVSYQPPRAGDIRHSRADNQRLQACYRLPSPTPLRQGLKQLLGLV